MRYFLLPTVVCRIYSTSRYQGYSPCRPVYGPTLPRLPAFAQSATRIRQGRLGSSSRAAARARLPANLAPGYEVMASASTGLVTIADTLSRAREHTVIYCLSHCANLQLVQQVPIADLG